MLWVVYTSRCLIPSELRPLSFPLISLCVCASLLSFWGHTICKRVPAATNTPNNRRNVGRVVFCAVRHDVAVHWRSSAASSGHLCGPERSQMLLFTACVVFPRYYRPLELTSRSCSLWRQQQQEFAPLCSYMYTNCRISERILMKFGLVADSCYWGPTTIMRTSHNDFLRMCRAPAHRHCRQTLVHRTNNTRGL
jgi:hypothetical protein